MKAIGPAVAVPTKMKLPSGCFVPTTLRLLPFDVSVARKSALVGAKPVSGFTVNETWLTAPAIGAS